MSRRRFLKSSVLIGTGVIAGATRFPGARAQVSRNTRPIIMAGYGPETTSFSRGLDFIGNRLEARFGRGIAQLDPGTSRASCIEPGGGLFGDPLALRHSGAQVRGRAACAERPICFVGSRILTLLVGSPSSRVGRRSNRKRPEAEASGRCVRGALIGTSARPFDELAGY